MSIGQEMPITGQYHQPNMSTRHYGRPNWSSFPVPKQQGYIVPIPPPQSHYWFPYDQSHPAAAAAQYRPLFAPAPTAYHTPPMQQAAFYPPPGSIQAQQPPFFYQQQQPLPPRHVAPTSFSTHPVVSACRDTAEYKSIAELYMEDPSSAPFRDLKLIPASASVIPPHPSVEDSAVPLAGIGADLVWEVVQEALAKGASRSGSASPPGFSFGTIGSERQAKQQAHVNASLAHYSLSNPIGGKTLIGPLTPPSSSMSSACPIPIQFQSDKFASSSQDVPPWSDSYWDANRSPETSPTVAGRREARPNPYSAFATFCENLLQVTLVTPQTLLLALHYVCQTCREAAPAIYQTFSARSAPYKLFVGALVMANKVLDDNSYKSQTWSQVSAVPLKDVNASEAFVFDALSFDVSMSSREWAEFVYGLALSYQRSRLADSVTIRRLTHLAAFKLP